MVSARRLELVCPAGAPAAIAVLLPGAAFSNGFLHGPCGAGFRRAS